MVGVNMFELAGIISQYGFEFQRDVFMYYLLTKMNVGIKLSYELLDDIDLGQEELGGTRTSAELIQCKTGKVSYDVFKHVICNWILALPANKYNLYLDLPLSFEYDVDSLCKDIKKDVYKYMSKERKRSNSFLYRINNSFNSFLTKEDNDSFKIRVKNICDNLEIENNTISDLKLKTKKHYFDLYCNDLTIRYAKESRFEMFSNIIRDEIIDSILKKCPYTIDHVRYSQVFSETIKCITDDKYNVEYYTFKKGKKEIFKTLLDTREAKFLKKIHTDDRIIARYLTNELYYMDLKKYYLGIDKDELIDDIEETANFNYLSEKNADVKETFHNTLLRAINDEILMNNEYRQGCYIYLSSDYAKDEYFIDWCGENAKTNE